MAKAGVRGSQTSPASPTRCEAMGERLPGMANLQARAAEFFRPSGAGRGGMDRLFFG